MTIFVTQEQKAEIEHNLNNKLCIILGDASLISNDEKSNALDRLRAAAIGKAADFITKFVKETFVVDTRVGGLK